MGYVNVLNTRAIESDMTTFDTDDSTDSTLTMATFTVSTAAEACGVSRKTIDRRLPQLAEHGASKDVTGQWTIPLSALYATGLRPGRPKGPDSEPPGERTVEQHDSTVQLIRTELDSWQRRATEAEKRAAVAEAESSARAAHISSLEHAMRALPAASNSASESVDQLRDQMTEMLARARAAEARAQRAEQVAYSASPWTTSTIAAFTVIALLVIAALVIAVVR